MEWHDRHHRAEEPVTQLVGGQQAHLHCQILPGSCGRAHLMFINVWMCLNCLWNLDSVCLCQQIDLYIGKECECDPYREIEGFL